MLVRRSRRRALGEQLYEGLRGAILRGELAAGARLPATRELATREGVARNTALRVYAQLAAEGYLVARPRAGTRVAPELPDDVPALVRNDVDGAAAPRRRRLSRRGRRLQSLAPSWMAEGQRPRLDFRYGRPSPDDLPGRTWRQVQARLARRLAVGDLDYGDPAGLPALRDAIAQHVARTRAVTCRPDHVLVTRGSQQALHLIAEVLLDRGDRVLIEEPGYAGAANVFRAAGAALIAAPVDRDGLDVGALGGQRAGARLVYTTPSHQFPTGVVMTLARRLALLGWASRARAWVVEDDYDSEFRFGTRPVESLQSLDRSGCVLYVGTLSKVLFPALRLGYLVVPEGLVRPLVTAKALADTGSAGLDQHVLAEFMRAGHFARHLRRLRTRHAARRAALLAALAEHLAGRVEVLGAQAGVHVMLRLRDIPVAREPAIVARAAALGVGVYSPARFFLAPRRRRDAALILGYGSLSTEEIRHGIARLARALIDQGRGVTGNR